MIGGDTSIRSSGGADLWKREDGSIRDQRTGVVYREEAPSFLIIDSQSVKSDAWAEDTGYDAGKKIKR